MLRWVVNISILQSFFYRCFTFLLSAIILVALLQPHVGSVQAQSCSGYIHCAVWETQTTCSGGSNAGQWCSDSDDCPFGSCKEEDVELGSGSTPCINHDGNYCRSSGCSGGQQQVGGGCRYIPPPAPVTPRPPSYPPTTPIIVPTNCGTNTCVSGQYCCSGACLNTPCPTPTPLPEEGGGGGGGCTKDPAGDASCAPGCCDPYTLTCTYNCGGGCPQDDTSLYSQLSVRFFLQSEGNSYIALKGSQGSDPIGTRAGNSGESVAGTSYTNGVPNQFRPYNSGTIRNFDWTKNRIDDRFQVVGIATEGAGTEIPMSNGCGGMPMTRIDGPGADTFSLHWCGMGLAQAEESDGLLNGGCRLASVNCSDPNDDKPCLKWCVEDVDGCIDSDWHASNGYWAIERPPKPPNQGDKTNLGSHEMVKSMINNFRAAGFIEQSRYDGLFTWNTSVQIKRRKYTGFEHYLRYIPPTGHTSCGRIIDSSGAENNNWRILSDAEKTQKGLPSGDCIISFKGLRTTHNLAMVIFDQPDYISQCFVDIDGNSQVTINTNTKQPLGSGSKAQVSLTAVSNDPGGQPEQRGLASLLFQKVVYNSDGSVSFAQPIPATPASAALPTGFVGTGINQFQTNHWTPPNGSSPASFYWRYRTTIQSQNLSPQRLISGPKFGGVGQAFFNTIGTVDQSRKMPNGEYFMFCEMPFGRYWCSGNPYCDHEGGTHPCDGFYSCSEPSGGFIQQVAILWNQVKHRRLVVQDNGTVQSYTAWEDGPFSFTQLGNTYLVRTLAMYSTKNNTFIFTWQQAGMRDPLSGEMRFQYWKVPHYDGFPDWKYITNNPNGTTATGYSLPAGVQASQITAHSIRFNQTVNLTTPLPDSSVLEYLFVKTSAGNSAGYYRVVPLTADGMPNFSGVAWQNSGIPTGTEPVVEFGNTLVPDVVENTTKLHQEFGRKPFDGNPMQYQRVVPISNNSTPTPSYASNTTFLTKIFTTLAGAPIIPDAFDEHYIAVGIEDKAKLTVTCLPSCTAGACGTTGGDDGCGGICPIAENNVNPNDIGTITMNPSTFMASTNDITVMWSRVPNAEHYEVIAYPIEGASAPTTLEQIQNEIHSKYISRGNPTAHVLFLPNVLQPTTGTSVASPLFNISSIKSVSPKLRIAVRGINTCSSASATTVGQWQVAQIPTPKPVNAPYQSASLLSDLSFRIAEVRGGACSTISSQTQYDPEFSQAHSFRLTNNNVNPAFSGFPYVANPRTISIGPDTINSTSLHTFVNVWHSLNGNYTIRPDNASALISQDNYQQICAATTSSLDGPESTTPVLYLRRAYDPWWQARGGHARAAGFLPGDHGDLTSRISNGCNGATNCWPYIITASLPSTPNLKTAGIPIAKTNIENRKSGTTPNGQLNSQASGNPHAALVGGVSSSFSYADLLLDIQNMISDSTRITGSDVILSGLGPSGTTGTVYAYKWPRSATSSPANYYLVRIFEGSQTFTIDPSVPPANQWNISSGQRVIILVNGSLTIQTTGGNPVTNPLTSVVDGGFLLVAARDDIIIDNSVGRAPSAAASWNSADPPVSLQGIFLAGRTLTINDEATPNVAKADNQFVGKGSFIGLQGVSLERDFIGTLTGIPSEEDLRFLNNTNPTEVFKFDASIVRNTPEFIKRPILSYEEVQ